MTSLRHLAHRIDTATPPGRDRAIDGLRAPAIIGVVLGHWLVTALVVPGHTVRASSPLRAMPELAPVSWVFQTLAVFFLVGGLVNGRRTRPYGAWLKRRLTRLFRPVGALAAVWALAVGAMFVAGAELETVRVLGKLAVSPLWFLLVFALLTAATPLVSRLHPGWPLAAVAFGLAQCGAAALLAGPLRRLLAGPVAWAAVAAVNLAAMTVFLWHQTAMIAVTVAALHTGARLPGLHTAPDGPGWIAARLLWLPVFAAALALCCLLFRTYERSSSRRVET